jgi:hypothetical protein
VNTHQKWSLRVGNPNMISIESTGKKIRIMLALSAADPLLHTSRANANESPPPATTFIEWIRCCVE